MTRPLAVGVQLPEVEWEARWRDLEAMSTMAEDVGFDSLWVGDHLLYENPRRGPWESWTTLAALAAVTERVSLGPLVAATSFHSPAMLAKKAITVDEISGGRLILGLGAGWNETEYLAFGFPYDHRVSRFAEAFEIIRTLVAGDRLDYAGRFYEVTDSEILPKGPRPEGPPIMIGSQGTRMLAITAPHMDMWNAWYAWFENDRLRLPPILEKVDRALASAGRDPADVAKTVAVLVGFDPAGRRHSGVAKRGEGSPISGSPAAVADELGAFAELGVSHLQLIIDPITEASIEAMGPVLERLDA